MIGVFDSGLGGLSVLRALKEQLPDYSYLYLGDTARVPYGNRSNETIFKYTKEAVEFLFKEGCQLVIIACNTASAQALRRLQQEWLPKHYPDRKVLGVIRPLAEAVANSGYEKIGLLGTRATVNSQAYPQEIGVLNPQVTIYSQAAPLLVPLVEEGRLNTPETRLILESYLEPLKQEGIEALILACTHYPYLQKVIEEILGDQVLVYNTGALVAESLAAYLERHPELGLKPEVQPQVNYCVTDSPDLFQAVAEKFLGTPLGTVKQVSL